jgi:hypothetical protein
MRFMHFAELAVIRTQERKRCLGAEPSLEGACTFYAKELAELERACERDVASKK